MAAEGAKLTLAYVWPEQAGRFVLRQSTRGVVRA
jgi:hypothetical protein